MKKILTAFAMVLLLAGCAKQYDDSAIKERIASLETRVTALETSIQGIQSAVGEGVFVQKVEEYADPDTGKTVGITVTYSSGKVVYFEISPKADYEGPVLGVITSGSGNLVWAIDGIAIEIDGKEVPVYQTPVFTIDDEGNLLVSIDGGEPVVVGQVQNEGATLVDGIFTDLKVEADKVVLTLSDGTKVNIPFAEPFKLVLETNDVVYEKKGDVITIPYTVSGKTEGTVVGVMGYNPNDFGVEVTESAIVITPYSSSAAVVMTAYADSRIGLVSLVELAVNHESARVINSNTGDAVPDFIVEAEGGTLEVKVVSNVEMEAIPDDDTKDWITVVDTKAMTEHTITLNIAANADVQKRDGFVDIYKKGTEKRIYSIYVEQEGVVAGPKDLGKKETANSYIVTEAGDYKFATVKGNSAESVGTVKEAVVLWETANTETAPEANSIIASVAYADGYVTFSTPATLKPGNALIAAKDADGVILWSWHIWIPETAVATNTYGFASRPIMDRNLGALIAGESTDAVTAPAQGLLYQWGRKDPFTGTGVAGQRDNYAKVAGEALSFVASLTADEAVANPTQFSKAWDTVVPDTAWGADAAKAVNDPCPAGYRVPAVSEMGDLFAGSGTKAKAMAGWNYDESNFRIQVGEPATVFPHMGFINNDGSYSRATRHMLWGAAPGTGAYIYEGPGVSGSGNKARGGSVRCIAVAAE